MRAAFVTADVLAADTEWPAALRRLRDAGIQPVVLVPRPLPDGATLPDTGCLQLSCAAGDPACWGDPPELLLDAATAADVSTAEAFLVCRDASDAVRGSVAGCRPVLLLGERTLDDIYGPEEPPVKEMVTALGIDRAVHYMIEEAGQEATLGPFPFGPHPHLARDERLGRRLPSTGDLMKILLVVVVGGIAVALGIAYLLQEIYQNYTFPRIAYWLTLQFIPQTWRGVLFLLIGGAIVVIALRQILAGTGRRGRGA